MKIGKVRKQDATRTSKVRVGMCCRGFCPRSDAIALLLVKGKLDQIRKTWQRKKEMEPNSGV
jgi:hypothetical protein